MTLMHDAKNNPINFIHVKQILFGFNFMMENM